MKRNEECHLIDIIKYGRKFASGGAAPGNMPLNPSQYRHGGGTHKRRHRHAEGGEEINPVTGNRVPSYKDQMPQKKYKGGRSCHADGDMVRSMSKARLYGDNDIHPSLYRKEGGEAKMKHGGGTHKRRHRHAEGGYEESREHHNFGDTVGDIFSGIAKTAPMWLPMLLKHGGDVSHRKHKRHR